MKFQKTPLGLQVITFPSFPDNRGSFVKIFHDTTLREQGIDFELKESYFSVSRKNVIRGLHFQLPPHQHSKIVYCPQGAILDVVVDLRKDSPTFGQYQVEELSATNCRGYYIPEGFAHGFKSLTDDAITCYLVSSEYNQAHDAGIHYNSIGFDWQVDNPVISERDLLFVGLKDFQSPF